MNEMADEEAYRMLQRIGFTHIEILCLLCLRRERKANDPLDPARLQFARFLVATGRLTDQIPESAEGAADLSTLEKQPILRMILAYIYVQRCELGLPPETWFYREYQ